MKEFSVLVVRKQAWTFIVEAEDKDEAMEKACLLAEHEMPHDDLAYSTEATEQ